MEEDYIRAQSHRNHTVQPADIGSGLGKRKACGLAQMIALDIFRQGEHILHPYAGGDLREHHAGYGLQGL